MSDSMVGILGFLFLFALLFLNMPIAFAFTVIGFLGVAYFIGFEPAMTTLIMTVWSSCTNYTLMAVPLFILMGQFAYFSGIGPDLYKAASRWWGKLPGGLAISTVWGCAGFSACTGSSTAGVLTFAPIAYKPMLNLNYSPRLALGSICCGATMGTLIPPSIGFIIYGMLTEESVGRLFMAGVFPGILEAVLYTAVIVVLAGLKIWPGPPGPSSTWKEKIISLKGVWGMLTLFALVLGGIYMGIFTPTEAAAIGAFGSLVILLIRRGFRLTPIWSGVAEALRVSCMVFTIVIGSMVFLYFISLSGLSSWLNNTILGLPFPPLFLVVAFLLVFFALGFVMPSLPIILLMVPIMYPAFVEGLGFSGIWYGVLVVVAMEMAYVTPPVGINLFALKGLLKEEAAWRDIYMGVLPFVFTDVIRLAILVAFPVISLWLPGMMYAR